MINRCNNVTMFTIYSKQFLKSIYWILTKYFHKILYQMFIYNCRKLFKLAYNQKKLIKTGL